tara:strand:+ start:169 stop:456 length:288 start_codon:yes stop_codon:yes gene_type:complete
MKKNRDRGKTTLLCEKESFLNAREFSHTLLFAFVCSSERERERKRKTKKTHFTPAKSVLRLVVLPCFLLLDSFEYLLKREEEEEQSLGEERNSST